jgi:hypothetical protein
METITWNDNKILMGKLWPRWAPSPEEASILNRKWGSLHQDKLRDCIEQHKLVRNSKPDISAIHKAYCAITPAAAEIAGRSEVDITRCNANAVQGPTPQEYAEWDAWAVEVLKTATQAEIDAARERIGVGVQSDRVLAVLVDYCRNTPKPL